MTSGTGMAVDIGEQPEVYARLSEPEQAARIAAIAATVAARQPRHVVLVADGSSGPAALYGAYLCEIRLGLPAALATASTVTVFGARPDLSHALVIGVDPGGGSAELAELLRIARASGALTLAVTNQPGSALARTAEHVIDVAAGPPRAVAASKTYTAALLALLMLVEGVRAGDGGLPAQERAALAVLPELAALTLADRAPAELAMRYRGTDRLITTGCGYADPTARAAALNLMETSYLAGLACSGTDLLHGPLALTDPGVPVLAVVGTGPGGATTRRALAKLGERRADLVVVGPDPVPGATAWLQVPSLAERHAPLLDILPLQQLALALAMVHGQDSDSRHGSAAR